MNGIPPPLLLLLTLSWFTIAECFVFAPSSLSHHHFSLKVSTATTTLHLQGDYLLSLERAPLEGRAITVEEVIESCGNDVDQNIPLNGCNDPYAPGVDEACGLTGSSGTDGFDEAADAVGPGIYGGSTQRDSDGNILIGTQYENHNHKPGPLYDGNGHSLMARAIHIGKDKVQQLIKDYPQLIDEISTGGARPLHICGMSPIGQHCTQTLIEMGADIHAVDTYNYNALHRMASNDLDVGAEALVIAGLDPNMKLEGADSTPIEIAKRQRAIKFLMTMQRLGHYD